MNQWITLKQFCALSGKSYPTVLSWVNTEKLVALRVGHQWRIHIEEYERYKRDGLLSPDHPGEN